MSRRLLAQGLILVVVAWTAWPLPICLSHAIPQGSEAASAVPILNLWTVGQNADWVRHGWADYRDGRVFAPFPDSFALSEPQATSTVVAPIVWIGSSPVAGYNVYWMMLLWLNGAVTFEVLRARGFRWPIALLGGCLMLRLPFVIRTLGVVQSLSVSGIVATVHFLVLECDRSRTVDFVLTGISLGLTYLTCGYYGLMLILILPVATLALLFNRKPQACARAAVVERSRRASCRLCRAITCGRRFPN